MSVHALGPNLPRHLADQGTIHVHRTGCADVKRYPYYEDTRGGWKFEATTIAEVIEEIYPSGDFDYDPDVEAEYQAYRGDVKVFPCVKLPEQAEA